MPGDTDAIAGKCETQTLTLAPNRESLADARRFVRRVATEAGFGEDRVFDMTVCASEAADNAVEHGKPTTPLQIATKLFPDRLELHVFSESKFELPASDYVRTSGAHRGMGFPLMAKLADHFALYSRVGGGTLVILTFFRPGYEHEKGSQDPLPPSQLELVTQHHLLSAILEASPVGIVVLDPEMRFRWANAAYRDFLDEPHRSRELVGLRMEEVLPKVSGSAKGVSQSGEALGNKAVPYDGFARGTTFWDSYLVPLKQEGQAPPYDVLAIVSDVTDRVRSEQQVRRKLDSLLSPEGDIGQLELEDLIDAPRLQSLLSSFHRLSRLPQAIIDLKGKVLVGEGWSDICMQFHRVHPDACRNCVESDTVLTKDIPEGEFRLYRCKNHMWDIATPLMVGGEHMGNVFCGQFFFDDEIVDRELFRSQAREYGFDEDAYLAALDRVPRLSRETVETGMFFFADLAALLSKESHTGIRLARALAERERLLETTEAAKSDLARAQELATTGSWRLDLRRGNELSWSDETYRIFELPPETPMTYEAFLECIHPDDRASVDRAWQRALDGETYDIEHRIVAGSEVKWVRERAHLEFDGDGRLAGGFGAVEDVTDRKRTEEALAHSRELYRALAEENERLYRQQFEIAEVLQGALLHVPSNTGGVRVGHVYRSATEAARVGGDFYDVFPVRGDDIAVLIGDVSGHGIEAARLAALTKDVIHAFAHHSADPHKILARTNELLAEKDFTGFVTVFLGLLDGRGGSFRYASAGHPEAILRRATGEIELLGGGSLPLGTDARAVWKPGAALLSPGDLLLLYTDGLTEARDDGEFFGEARLHALMQRDLVPVERLPEAILEEVLAFSRGNLRDDVAIVALALANDARLGGAAEA